MPTLVTHGDGGLDVDLEEDRESNCLHRVRIA